MRPDFLSAERASPPPPGRPRGRVAALWSGLGRRPELEAWRLRDEWPWPALVALGLLLVYAWCAPRTVALEDDGLFILASYFNGIAHPPGYPVFTLIGHLFAQLPFGSVAWRVHLVSALFGALTCAVLWCIVRSLVPSRAIATAAALAYGFSEAFWSQAIIAEVYTLNTFVTFLLVLLLLRLSAAGDVGWRDAGLLGLVYGIGLSNHWPLLVLFSPAYLLLAWPLLGSLWRRAPALLFGLGLGLLPYLWLYLRSQMEPQISFFGPFEGWSELFQFVSRSTYGGADHAPGVVLADKLGYLRFQAANLVDQFTLFGFLVALTGLLAWRRHRAQSAALVLGALCVSLVLILVLDREYDLVGSFVYRVYPLPAYGVMAILLGLGLQQLRGMVSALPTVALRHALGAGALVAAVLLPALIHAAQNYRGDYIWAEQFARAVLDELPPGAIFMSQTDVDALPVGYVHLVLGYRKDVTVQNVKALVFRDRPFDPWVNTTSGQKDGMLRELVDRAEGAVCFVGIDGFLEEHYSFIWHGLTSCIDRSVGPGRITMEVADEAVARYVDLQRLRDPDNWTMMAADSLDSRMVHVLLVKLMRAQDEVERARYARTIDIARNGLRGKQAFVRFARQSGYPLEPDLAIELLDEGRKQTDRAYSKSDLVELHLHLAGEHERADRPDEARAHLIEAVKARPIWRNAALPRLLTELFRSARGDDVRLVASLARELGVIEELYGFFVANRGEGMEPLTMVQGELRVVLYGDGRVSVK